MKKTTFGIVTSAIVLLLGLGNASALDLSKLANDTAEPVKAYFGCGKLKKANCEIVGTSVQGETSLHGLELELAEGEGSGMSAEATCDGVIQFAVGQADTFNRYMTDPRLKCTGKIAPVASMDPYYQYSLYLVVPANAPYNTLEKLVAHFKKKGQLARIAAGNVGSGGQDTMGKIAEVMKKEYAFELVYDGGATALMQVASGQYAAFAFMDGPDSSLVATVKDSVNAKTGKSDFKFIEPNLPSRFYKDAKNYRDESLYSRCTIDIPGVMNDVDTLCTPAIAIVNVPWMREHADAVATFAAASNRVQGKITGLLQPK